MRLCQNTRGFTLIETLIALFVLAVVAASFPLWLHVLNHSEPLRTLDPMEVELFFQQTGMEIREAKTLKTHGGHLILQKYNADKVSYLLKNGVIRRRVNGRGSVWMLNHVRTIHFNLLGTGVKIIVSGRKGVTYERIFFPFAPERQ